jgi:hypothetical protein
MPITPRERLASVLGGSKAPDPFSTQLTVPARDVRLTVTARDRSVSRSGRRRLRLRHEITCPPLSTNAIIHRHTDHLIRRASQPALPTRRGRTYQAGIHAADAAELPPFVANHPVLGAAKSGVGEPVPADGIVTVGVTTSS